MTPAAINVWVTVCCDNIVGVASSQARADELYRCGHAQDSFCCFTEVREIDAVSKPAWQPPRRHRMPVEQEALPL